MNPNIKPTRHIVKAIVHTAIWLMAISAVWAHALPDDKNQTMRISAEKQEVDLKQGVVIYSGDVKLNQGTLEITADKIRVYQNKNQEVESFIAEGNLAHYQQQPEAGKPVIHAEAGTINYNVKTEQLVLDKNVSIEQDGSVTKSDHLDYDIKSQTAKFSGKGRVETVIPAKTVKKE